MSTKSITNFFNTVTIKIIKTARMVTSLAFLKWWTLTKIKRRKYIIKGLCSELNSKHTFKIIQVIPYPDFWSILQLIFFSLVISTSSVVLFLRFSQSDLFCFYGVLMFYIPSVLWPLFSLCVTSGNIQLKDPCTQKDFQDMMDQFQRYYQSLMAMFGFFSPKQK